MRILTASLALVGLVCAVQGVVQVADVYEQTNQGGSTTRVYDNCQDLSGSCVSGNWNNRIRSTCIYGTWIFFENTDFNPAGTGGAEWAWGSGYCFNLGNAMLGRSKSMRYVGDVANNEAATVSLFINDYFQGPGITIQGNVPNLSGVTIGSIITTGNLAYTVWSETGYGGQSACLLPDGNKPVFYINLSAVGISKISSVSLGCSSDVVARGFSPEKEGHGHFPRV
ncbi:unnamed protein product [Cyprideis torosa]|uniref:Uncharacterized protein n=1 Tax=Cyprideis torosa TaxID=163714 RepID=A0A7R8W9I1_9CRUS|nr:unnamed protein product [Cyprideis torosa]CAG0889808.1 unnamed protein product [Cyprideis torosa]